MSCPQPLKRRYPNPREACEALERIWATPPQPGEKRPIRIYPCRCNGWHLTSQPANNTTTE